MVTEINSESTLQEVLDFQYSKAGGSLRSIIIRNRKGDCIVKPNVNIRFYNCTFSSFKSTENNIFFFRNCTFKGEPTNFNIEKASIIADQDTSFETRIRFKNSSLQLMRTKNKASHIYENVQLFSYNSVWEPVENSTDTVGIFADNSRLILIEDRISKWSEYFIKATNKSFIKIDKPSEINTNNNPFLNIKDSVIELWNIKNLKDITQNNSGKAIISLDNSSFLLNSPSTLRTNGTYFESKNSKITIEKALKLISTNDSFFKTKDSNVLINGAEQVSSSSSSLPLFKSEGQENYILKNIKELKSVSKLITFEKADIKIIGDNSNTIQSEKDVIFSGIDTSFLLIKDINTIKSISSSIFNIKNTTLNVDNINVIESTSPQGYILSSEKGSSTFSNIFSIKSSGEDLVRIENNSKLSLFNVKNIEGSGKNSIKVLSNSKVLCNNIEKIKSNEEAIYLENSEGIFKNIESIQGEKALNGVSSKARFFNVINIEGDIEGDRLDISFDTHTTPSIVKKITLKGLPNNLKEASFSGLMSIKEAYFENYIIKNKNTKWEGNVSLKNAVFSENVNSSFENIALIDSVLNNIKTRTGQITADSSVVTLTKSLSSGISLNTLSSVIGHSSIINDLILTNSAASLMTTDIPSMVLSGKSSLLGAGLSSTTATFNSGDPSITGVGLFVNSGGNLGLQADNDIISEANYIREKSRSEIIEDAVVKISNIVGNTSVVVEPTQILESATNKISSIVASSSIITEPSQIVLTSTTLIKLVATSEITLDATTINL